MTNSQPKKERVYKNPATASAETIARAKSFRAKRFRDSPKQLIAAVARGEDITGRRAIMRMGETNTKILTGLDDLSDWTDEELKRGARRNIDGGWTGANPRIVPKALHDELVRRTLGKAQELMRENLNKAVQALCDIAISAETDDKARVVAIKMIMDRVMGTAPITVAPLAERKRWQVALEKSIVSVRTIEQDGEKFINDPLHKPVVETTITKQRRAMVVEDDGTDSVFDYD